MGDAAGGFQVGDRVKAKEGAYFGTSTLAGKEGVVVAIPLPALNLLVEFVGFDRGHDGFGTFGKNDGVKNRWYVSPASIERVLFKKGERVRYTGRRGALCPGDIGHTGTVAYDGSPLVVAVDWDKFDSPFRRVYPQNIEVIQPELTADKLKAWAAVMRHPNAQYRAYVEAAPYPESFGGGSCCDKAPPDVPADPAPPKIGDFVKYEDNYHQVIAIIGYEAWIRDGAGVNDVVDIMDVEPVSATTAAG